MNRLAVRLTVVIVLTTLLADADGHVTRLLSRLVADLCELAQAEAGQLWLVLPVAQ